MSEKLQIEFLDKSLSTMHQLRASYDNKANFLLGVSGILFVLAIAHVQQFYFFVIVIFSLLSSILCILSIILPFRGRDETGRNLFCWWGIKGKKYNEYFAEITEKIKEQSDVIREYTKEIFSLYNNSIRYKAVFLKLSSLSLLAGFVIVLWYLII